MSETRWKIKISYLVYRRQILTQNKKQHFNDFSKEVNVLKSTIEIQFIYLILQIWIKNGLFLLIMQTYLIKMFK